MKQQIQEYILSVMQLNLHKLKKEFTTHLLTLAKIKQQLTCCILHFTKSASSGTSIEKHSCLHEVPPAFIVPNACNRLEIVFSDLCQG